MAQVRHARPSYKFKQGESVPAGLKRVVREQLDEAIRQLSGPGENRTDAIHEARKSLKKIRSVLRLMRKELGHSYRIETTQLRLRGRQLSDIRDAAARIETVDTLRNKVAPELGLGVFSSIRRTLVARRDKFEQEADAAGIFRSVASALRAVVRRVKTWPLETDGFAALSPGIEGSFRRGRKAFRSARENPNPEHLHAWRKCVKDLWYQMRLLEPVWNKDLDTFVEDLKDLQEWLGEHQNLAILRGNLTAHPEVYGEGTDLDAFLRVAEEHQVKMRSQALALGEAVYRQSPGRFLKEVHQSWRDHPLSSRDPRGK